jgi:hypothetical protein
MKSILVPVEEHVFIHNVLKTALLLGRALNGCIEGLAITPNMPPYIASDLAISDISFLDPRFAASELQPPAACLRRSWPRKGFRNPTRPPPGCASAGAEVSSKRMTLLATMDGPSTSRCSGDRATKPTTPAHGGSSAV